jgi:YjbE family integral membrane protein
MTNVLTAFANVTLVDLVLAGDNIVVVGALAAGLPQAQRRIALAVGTLGAMGARIALSLVAAFLLMIPGLKIIGGLLLFWVAWRMWREMRAEAAGAGSSAKQMGLTAAIGAIISADITMSLDNVLAVAGAADGHLIAMAFGLMLSVFLMWVGASMIAEFMQKHRWVGYVGLGLVLLVAVRMVLGL